MLHPFRFNQREGLTNLVVRQLGILFLARHGRQHAREAVELHDSTPDLQLQLARYLSTTVLVEAGELELDPLAGI